MGTRPRKTRLVAAALAVTLVAAAPAAAAGPQPRIVGGTDAAPGEFPWQVSLQRSNGEHVCGGVLLDPTHVVTADHCLPLSISQVRAGSVTRSSGGVVIGVAGVRRHPLAHVSGTTPRWDVAMLRLAGAVTPPSGFVRPVTPAEQAAWTPATVFTASGWGRTSQGAAALPETLQHVGVPWVGDAACANAYPTRFSAGDMLCAGELLTGGKDACQGDSGGPLVAPATAGPQLSDAGDWVLAGLTSWGVGCAQPGSPGVYVRLGAPAIHDWLALTPPAPSTPGLSGTPAVGGTLTCEPGPWSGGSAYVTYRFFRQAPGQAEQLAAAGTSAQYVVTVADAGAAMWCRVRGENAVATVDSARSPAVAIPGVASPAVAASPPASDPAPAPGPPADTPPPTQPVATRASAAPAVTSARRRCTRRRRCSFTITAADGTTTVRARLTTTVTRRCRRGARRTTCRRTIRRTLRVRRTSPTRFVIDAVRLAKGRHSLALVAVAADGRRETRPLRLAFRL
jgi:trypsin